MACVLVYSLIQCLDLIYVVYNNKMATFRIESRAQEPPRELKL